MVRQFAAHVTNTDTHDEYMIVANTAEKAATLGAQQVKAEAEKGFAVQMVIGNVSGATSLSEGQVLKMSGWQ